MSTPATISWFAAHEVRLAWRDWAAMMAGGRTTREKLVTSVVLLFIALLHWFAYAVLSPVMRGGVVHDQQTLIVITVSLLTTFCMMLSQAIEHVTRAFYARADLDLILSSPAPAKHVFVIRILSIAATGSAMTALLVSPFVNMAALIDGPRWLSAYLVIAVMGAFAVSIALAITMFLFRTLGTRRTRLVAQILAAVVGAALLIAIQAVAVVTYGNFSRLTVLKSPELAALAPNVDSLFWLPARAVLGDVAAAFWLCLAAAGTLYLSVVRYADLFADHVIAAAGAVEYREQLNKKARPYRPLSSAQALRAKEWALLARDPWLVSQSLMQLLYLIPPALMLWRDMGSSETVHVILAPVLVMAFGQLAGGLAWLAISGEDAHDLVATAPITPRAMTRAKVEAVLAVIAAGSAPFVLALAFISPWGAAMTAAGIACAGAAAIVIQFWFRSTAKRSQFRRRQVASRWATFSEAFSSIFWAGASGLAAAKSVFALGFVMLALIVLALTYVIRPRA